MINGCSAIPTFIGNKEIKDGLSIVGGDSIKVTQTTSDGKIVYTIDYVPYVPSQLNYTTTPKVVEVGSVTDVVISGAIVEGSSTILSRNTNTGLDLTIQDSVTFNNISSDIPGVFPEDLFVSIIDSIGQHSISLGTKFVYPSFVGYSVQNSITSNEDLVNLDRLLVDNIISSLASKTYNYTALPVYIYWLVPTIYPQINSAIEGPLPVPLYKGHSNITLNINGNQVPYTVVRTATSSVLNLAKIKLQ